MDNRQDAQLEVWRPGTVSTEYRQTRRARARFVANSILTKTLGRRITRKARRVGARGYATAAWRHRRGLPMPAHHRYDKLFLNREIMIWTMNEAGL